MNNPGTALTIGKDRSFSPVDASEEQTVAFLFNLRWPDGFLCPSCKLRSPQISPGRTILCPKCGNASSLTTGTLMHGTKKRLKQWLLAIWWLSGGEEGNSARELQRLLRLPSYQTAWTWLQKLRLAIGWADREPCRGVVELGCSKVTPAWERREQAMVLTAAECILPLGITGRIRMRNVEECNDRDLLRFLQTAVTRDSSLVAPGFPPFTCLEQARYAYVIDSRTEIPKRIEELNRSFEIWLNKVHRGGVGLKHLQLYLDEFCFHNNASLMGDREAIFTALVHGVLEATPRPYREIIQTSNGGNKR